MKDVYNNIIDLLTSPIEIPIWLLVLMIVVLLITSIWLVGKSVKILDLEDSLEESRSEIIMLSHKIEAKEETISKQWEQIKKKENTLQAIQKELNGYRDRTNKAVEIIKEVEHKTNSKARPSRSKDTISDKSDSKSLNPMGKYKGK